MSVKQLASDNQIEIWAAQCASRGIEGRKLDRVAKDVARTIRSKALAHKKSGDLAESVHTDVQITKREEIYDRVVVLDRDAVAHVEFGHYMGAKDTPNRRHVKGIFIVRRSVRSVARRKGIGKWGEGE